MISKKAADMIIGFEVSSEANYAKNLRKPIWPGGESGITIGIGYDLGYVTKENFKADWTGVVDSNTIDVLCSVCGLKGEKARQAVANILVQNIRISYEAACKVFTEKSLPKYYAAALKIYPGMDELTPDAQGALTSLVYNRGTSLEGHKRTEMAAIVPLVKTKDYYGIAIQLLNMKRLWPDQKGLRERREKEAALVISS